MSGWIRKSVGWAVGVFGVLAMAFGASVALAKPVNAMTCPNDGFNTLGQKPSENACIAACYDIHGEELYEGHWVPSTGCCSCLL
jgi:hypothetical protein